MNEVDVPSDDRPMFSKPSEYFNVLSEESISECTVLPPLRSVKRNKLMHIVNCVNNLCQFIDTSDLRATADLMYAAAKVVTEAVGLSCQRGSSTPDYANPLGSCYYKINLLQCEGI